MSYTEARYQNMIYNRCGRSGLLFPAISLGLWQNFGGIDVFETGREVIIEAFDKGITHFDLANNYGPPPGSAEENFGRILKSDLLKHRDEMIISTKAGYYMWDGPYGDGGSRKYLISSLDQSLKRMGLEYVDIFYHHRPDKNTPLIESMLALYQIVKSGKALYVGISNYTAEQTVEAYKILKDLNTPLLIHQPRYNMLDRWIEPNHMKVFEDLGIGAIVFSPLAQGILTNKYLNGVPEDSRAARDLFLKKENITEDLTQKMRAINEVAEKRGQSLAQMAIAWVLKDKRITSALIGARNKDQLLNSLEALQNPEFTEEELKNIDQILSPIIKRD